MERQILLAKMVILALSLSSVSNLEFGEVSEVIPLEAWQTAQKRIQDRFTDQIKYKDSQIRKMEAR